MGHNWGFDTTAEEVGKALAPQIKGKNVIITGASPKSLGAYCAHVLAANGAGLVVLAGRSLSNLEQTASSIKKETPSANVRLLEVDLESMKSVRKAAAEVLAFPESFQVVFLNAAIMAVPFKLSEETKLESQFTTNHLGHFLLCNLILPKIQGSTEFPARIINVSSAGHVLSPVRFDDINFGNGKDYFGWPAYGQSKTANVLFARELAKRLADKGILSFSLHPGGIKTGLDRNISAEDKKWIGFFDEQGNIMTEKLSDYKQLSNGTATHIVAGFDPSIVGSNGAYLEDCQVHEDRCKEYAKDMGNAERLWKMSEEIVGEKFL